MKVRFESFTYSANLGLGVAFHLHPLHLVFQKPVLFNQVLHLRLRYGLLPQSVVLTFEPEEILLDIGVRRVPLPSKVQDVLQVFDLSYSDISNQPLLLPRSATF